MTDFSPAAQALYDMLTEDMKAASRKMDATRTEPGPHLNAQRAYNEAFQAREQLCIALDPEGYDAALARGQNHAGNEYHSTQEAA